MLCGNVITGISVDRSRHLSLVPPVVPEAIYEFSHSGLHNKRGGFRVHYSSPRASGLEPLSWWAEPRAELVLPRFAGL
jgi:hypothetical protein